MNGTAGAKPASPTLPDREVTDIRPIGHGAMYGIAGACRQAQPCRP